MSVGRDQAQIDLMGARRKALLHVIGANRNTWMVSFGWASHHICVAVANGTITEDEIRRFVPYHTEDCIALAKRAGIYPGTLVEGEYSADDEDVSISVEAIRGLLDQSFAPETNPWYFHAEENPLSLYVEGYPTSWREIEQARVENITSYRGAAQFILDADRMYTLSRV